MAWLVWSQVYWIVTTPPLSWADAASTTTVFEHLARLSPEPCSGLCKQSYQTNTINNNLSWVGFYGSRYPGSPGSIERGREVAARDRARNWCLVITFYRQNNSDIDHNSGGIQFFDTGALLASLNCQDSEIYHEESCAIMGFVDWFHNTVCVILNFRDVVCLKRGDVLNWI